MAQMKLVERGNDQMTQKEMDDMERCAAFIARMIEQYGEEILAEIEAEDRVKSEQKSAQSEGIRSQQPQATGECNPAPCEQLVKTNRD